jgi:hypothetical protein
MKEGLLGGKLRLVTENEPEEARTQCCTLDRGCPKPKHRQTVR